MNNEIEPSTVDTVLSDLARFMNDANAAFGFATSGLRQLATFLEGMPTPAENPDPMIFIGVGDPNDPRSQAYARWRRSNALQQIAPGSMVHAWLGQAWIVFVYENWEQDFRRRLAAAHGCDSQKLDYPLFGDLRRMRHDVVHRRGIATQEWTGRCKTLTWFRPGEAIILRGEHYAEFMRLFPWQELARRP